MSGPLVTDAAKVGSFSTRPLLLPPPQRLAWALRPTPGPSVQQSERAMAGAWSGSRPLQPVPVPAKADADAVDMLDPLDVGQCARDLVDEFGFYAVEETPAHAADSADQEDEDRREMISPTMGSARGKPRSTPIPPTTAREVTPSVRAAENNNNALHGDGGGCRRENARLGGWHRPPTGMRARSPAGRRSSAPPASSPLCEPGAAWQVAARRRQATCRSLRRER